MIREGRKGLRQVPFSELHIISKVEMKVELVSPLLLSTQCHGVKALS